jgi:dsRNA-specific ribonuclease
MTRANRAARRVLSERIAYKFGDDSLLEQALTHISAVKDKGRVGSYQRLEFLGDRVLGLAISEMLFAAFPKADEGELSKRLAELVRKETCAEIARSVDLGEAIKLGSSEANAGGRRRTAVLADVCEALIGAVFLDGGLSGGGRPGGAAVGRAFARARPPAARRQDCAAGMGAGTRAADAVVSRDRTQRAAP